MLRTKVGLTKKGASFLDIATAVGGGDGDLFVGLPNIPANRPSGGNAPSLPQVAFWNEFGTKDIPQRPAIRMAMATNRDAIRRSLIARASYNKRKKDPGLGVLMGRLGAKIVEQIKRSIGAWRTPANAESTIAKKGFNNPLVHTGLMSNSWQWWWVPRKSPGSKKARDLDKNWDI